MEYNFRRLAGGAVGDCVFSVCVGQTAGEKTAAADPRRTLLGISFFGGAIGAYVAMLHFRHKTRHWYFHAVNLLGIAWQACLLIWLLLL